jgi:hypothetical protein
MKPILFSTAMVQAILAGCKTQTRRVVKPTDVISGSPNSPLVMPTVIKSPHKAGDILWVRETWGSYSDTTPYYLYRADYPADAIGFWHEHEHINWCDFPKWRPSIHMPREAARLFLRVTDVRVQRVQDITSSDIEQEGVDTEGLNTGEEWKYAFSQLWDSINAKRGYGWDVNPFCWAYTFERTGLEAQG